MTINLIFRYDGEESELNLNYPKPNFFPNLFFGIGI